MNKTIIVSDPTVNYYQGLVYAQESYDIIGCCFEVHRVLGKGFLETVYQEALSEELTRKGISFELEKSFQIPYKEIFLKKNFVCDFVILDKIILEIKAQKNLAEDHASQIINYLAVTRCKLGLLVNFGEDKLQFKRYIL